MDQMKKLYFAIILFTSCVGNVSNKSSIINCPEINPLEITKEISTLEGYIDTMKIIDVNKGREYFNIDNAKKIIVLDNGEIIFLMNKIVKFDSIGNYIRTYGDFGRGNGEYIKIYDICLNIDKTEVWALDYTNQVIKYDFQSGKYIGTIKTNYHEAKITNTSGIIPSKDDGLYLVSLNESEAKKINYDFSYLTTFDKNGAYVKSLLQLRDFNFDYPYSAYVTYSLGKYIIRPQENDNICYVVENGELLPFLRIHFGNRNIEPLFGFKYGVDPWTKFEEIIESDFYKYTMSIQLTNKHLFFSTLRPRYSQESFLINREKQSGIRWPHKCENAHSIFIIGSDKENFYCVYTYHRDHDNISANESALINYIVKRIDKDKEGEPLLLKIKFK